MTVDQASGGNGGAYAGPPPVPVEQKRRSTEGGAEEHVKARVEEEPLYRVRGHGD